MSAYDTAALIVSIKRRAFIPTSQSTFTPADFLDMADEELQSSLLPLVMSLREEFYVAASDQTITAGVGTYRIPTRAIGNKLRDVLMVDSAGAIRNLDRLDPSELPFRSDQNNGKPWGFYLENANIVLWPSPDSTAETLRLKYFIRPGRLVVVSDVTTATAVSSTQVTSAAVPSTFSTSTPLDFVRATPGFEQMTIDKTPTNKSGTVLTFASAVIPSGFAVGDYVCLAGESAVPQLPVELHPVLAQKVAVQALDSMGDSSGMQRASARLSKMEKELEVLLAPRVDGEIDVLTSESFFPLETSRWG